MTTTRISLANVRPASNPEESLSIVLQAIGEAAAGGASIVCFPECYVPGYRTQAPQSIPDQAWLDRTWARVDEQASDAGIAVILGTERVVAGRLVISARVTNADGQLLGFQDKVQLDPSEEPIYAPGEGRQVFHCGQLTFGIVICHEGWRYPELTRWAVVQGATIVFHPHFELVENPQLRPGAVCGSRQHVSRKGSALPFRGEHVFLRDSELRPERVHDDVCRC